MGKGDETRQVILAEAAVQASRLGLAGLTIGSLASGAGLSKSGLFAHFRSKEQLQLAVLDHNRTRFIDTVVRPALATPRGEPRVRALFERWLDWGLQPGGCLFVNSTFELDDRPGATRDWLVSDQRDWLDTLAQVFRTGITEGHFRADADPDQFATEEWGAMLAFHSQRRLLSDPNAGDRALRTLDRLIDSARA